MMKLPAHPLDETICYLLSNEEKKENEEKQGKEGWSYDDAQRGDEENDEEKHVLVFILYFLFIIG